MAAHLSDEELAALDDGDAPPPRAAAHAGGCDECRRRRAELASMRTLLAASAEREEAPRRDIVPGAIKRLRLRRHAVVNANEFLGSLVALVRGFATLFTVAEAGSDRGPRERFPEDDRRG